jgi:hypothetical protein
LLLLPPPLSCLPPIVLSSDDCFNSADDPDAGLKYDGSEYDVGPASSSADVAL